MKWKKLPPPTNSHSVKIDFFFDWNNDHGFAKKNYKKINFDSNA